ncbi:MAG: hypothetical protein M1378_09090 [Bacteroidetes bacterium]|nr:hypothetical protein [Bacteroidota bacterium]
MIGHQEVNLLTNYIAREGVAISFYLNTDGSERGKNVWDIETKDLVKNVRKELESLNIGRKYIEAADVTLKGIQRFVSMENPAARYKSLAIFANSVENFYQIYWLPMPVKSNLVIDTNFYLRPLLAMLEEHYRIGVVLADSRHVRFFEVYMGEIMEHRDLTIRTKPARKPLLETFMKREKRLMQRKEEETRFHLSSVADMLKSLCASRHLDKIIIGARKPLGDHLARLLHVRHRSNLIGIFEIDIHAKENEVLSKALKAEREFEFDEERILLRKISGEVEKDGYAVKGIKKVVEATQEYNMQILAVAEDFSQPGLVCTQCGMPHLEEGACVCCGGMLVQVSDVIYDVVEEAVRQGATVRHIRGENLIGSLENVAAIIKFKKGELVRLEETAETEI